MRYQVPFVPQVDKFVLKIVLNDTSRRVSDNYILISDADLKAPFGALVVTVLPSDLTTVEAAFGAVDTMQRDLAQPGFQSVERREISDSRLGRGVEYVTANRAGTLCYPTSKYKYVADDMKIRTVGISRFFVQGNELVELAFIVSIPDAVQRADQNAFARTEMDRYVVGLTFTNPAR